MQKIFYNKTIELNNPPYVFGDGNHETTRFLLYFLNKYAKGNSMIDAGCGTGILSIFCSHLGFTDITAIDYDSSAIECTTKNFQTNNVSASTIQNDIRQLDPIQADVVTANLPREEAFHLILNLKSLVNENGILFTTWYKELPSEIIDANFTIIDYIEGIDYNCYVLKCK